MEAVRLEKLQEYIALPDMRKRIVPTLLFRGTVDARHMHSMFNFACAMMLAECQSFSEGSKLYLDAEFGHWCGLHSKSMQTGTLRAAFNRLKLCPEVTAIVPTLTEYVEYVWPRTFHLEPVTIEWEADRAKRKFKLPEHRVWVPPARKVREKKAKIPVIKLKNLAYPYIEKECKHHNHGADLLMAVHSLVPKGIPHEIRGDLCQDLIVAVLSGETSLDNLPNTIDEYIWRANKFIADRRKMKSIDAPLGFDSDQTLSDVLSADEVAYA